ncbi:MAG: zinc-ribbon domain-containing protein [Oscillospiraceae bacterium]|nr:zinc-ribbon domain-containing protein [Oscillospiraceae bacterium]
MAYCRQCGAQLPDGASFCPSCGARDEAGGGFGQARYDREPHQPNDVEDNKMISILCYFGLLFLVPYLSKQDSPFVKFHSNQGLVLFILALIVGIVSKIPFIGWAIGLVCGVFIFVCFILGIVNVLNGEMKELPLIGQIQVLK